MKYIVSIGYRLFEFSDKDNDPRRNSPASIEAMVFAETARMHYKKDSEEEKDITIEISVENDER